MEILLKILAIPLDALSELIGLYNNKKAKRYEFYYLLLIVFAFVAVIVYYGVFKS